MLTCPKCRTRLNKTTGPYGEFWFCGQCGGRSAAFGQLRKRVPRPIVDDLIESARRATVNPRECPACAKEMHQVRSVSRPGLDLLDVCSRCRLVWFDPQEYEALPSLSESRMLEMDAIRDQDRLYQAQFEAEERKSALDQFSEFTPGTAWKMIPAILNLPIETYNSYRIRFFPYVTWCVAAMCVLVYLLTFHDLHTAIRAFGFIPELWYRYGGVTIATSFFLHGGIMHLVGNLYFFLIFGDDAEDYLGAARYAAMLAGATLVGHLTHSLGELHSDIPCVGASGGISGVIAFYALRFSDAQISMFWGFGFYRSHWVTLPAWTMFFLWAAFQFAVAFMQMYGLSSVSALAHLGGAAVGAGFWWYDAFVLNASPQKMRKSED